MTVGVDVEIKDAEHAFLRLRVKTAQTAERRLARSALPKAVDIAREIAVSEGIGRRPATHVHPDGFVQNQRPNGGPHYLDAFRARLESGPGGGFPFRLILSNSASSANLHEHGARSGTARPKNRKVMLWPGVNGDSVFGMSRPTPRTPAKHIMRRAVQLAIRRASR